MMKTKGKQSSYLVRTCRTANVIPPYMRTSVEAQYLMLPEHCQSVNVILRLYELAPVNNGQSSVYTTPPAQSLDAAV